MAQAASPTREDDLEGQENWEDLKDVVCAHTLARSIARQLAFLQNETPLLRAPQQSARFILDRRNMILTGQKSVSIELLKRAGHEW